MANTDLNVRIVNKSDRSQTVMLYQKDENLNVENYHIAAWSVTKMAPGATHDFILPFAIQVQARTSADVGAIRTAVKRTDYNASWDIIRDGLGALDITLDGSAPPAGNDTVNIWNKVETEPAKTAVALKDGVPLFSRNLDPGRRVNFKVTPSLYVLISSDYAEGKLYKAVTLTPQHEVAYSGKRAAIIEFTEDTSHLLSFTHKFVTKIDSFQPTARYAAAA